MDEEESKKRLFLPKLFIMEYIEQLNIENFRGFNSLQIDDCAKINVLIGKNDVGKTSILEAIFLLSGMSNPQLALNINMLRGIFPQNIQNLEYLFHNLNLQQLPTLKAIFSNRYYRKLQLSPLELKITELSERTQGNYNFQAPALSGLNLDFFEKYPDKEQEDHYKSSLEYLTDKIQYKMDNNYIEEIKASFIHSEGSQNNPSDIISQIVKEKKDEELLHLLQEFDSDIETFKMLPDGLYIGMKGIAKLMLSNVVGGGLKKFIAIAANMVAHQNSIVLIDELENGIHYSAYPLIWKALFKSVQNNNNQLFITTHSYEELVALQHLLRNNAVYQPQMALYMINKSEKNGFEAFRYGYEGLNSAIENENEIRN